MRKPHALRRLTAVWILASAAHAGDQDWTEVKSPHFVVRSNAGSKEARRVALRFEQVRAVMKERWPWARVDPGRPLLIAAVRDAASFDQLMPSFHERKGAATVAGATQARIDKYLVVLRTDVSKRTAGSGLMENPYHVLFHEYIHVIEDLNLGSIPAWLSEGLAEYWGDAEVDGDRLKVGQPMAGPVMLLRTQPLLPAETLFRVDQESPHYWEQRKADVFYAQSWALVHYFFNSGPSGPDNALSRYVALLRTGVPPTEAARQALPPPETLTKALRDYVQQPSFKYREGPAPLNEGSANDYLERPLPPAELLSLRGDVLARDGRKAEAEQALNEAARLDLALAAPWETLGTIAYFDQDYAAASERLGRAVALESTNAFVYYLQGMIALRSDEPPSLAEAERALRRAARLRPTYAFTYDALAEAAVRRHAPFDQIEDLALAAIALEPGVPEHRLRMAYVLANSGRLEWAKTLVENAIKTGRASVDRASATDNLETLKRELKGRVPSTEGCEKGDAAACTVLAQGYRNGLGGRHDLTEAARLFQKACDGGDASGCAGLGRALEKGEAVGKDEARAATAYEKGCGKRAESLACARLAWLLEEGRGVLPDLARAASLYAQACTKGSAWSCVRYGFMLDAGKGVAPDPAAAAVAYEKACDGAIAEGCARLASLHDKGRGVPREGARVLLLLEQACELAPEACPFLARAVTRGGGGGGKDEARAMEVLTRVCDGGAGAVCTETGLVHLAHNTRSEQVEAFRFFKQACDGGEAHGCHELAQLVDGGVGVSKDRAQARVYFDKACKGGYEPSCQQLKASAR